ncbi:MAG: hypothetical protein HRU20_20765 [Pseudomonadales bacterium]|nr:hypothetical protein [Pseudomonadales bacterium]
MNNASDILEGFKSQGWESAPYEQMLKLKNHQPKQLLSFVHSCMQDIPEGCSFMDAALSYVTEVEFQQLVSMALLKLEVNKRHKAAHSVIHHAQLQFPQLLKTKPSVLPEVQHIIFAEHDLPRGSGCEGEHLAFQEQSEFQHPSWQLVPKNAVLTDFGGEISSRCGCCDNTLQQLIHLPAKTCGNQQSITLATCTACLGWEEDAFFYRHDYNGVPEAIHIREEKCMPFFLANPFKATQVYISQTPSRWLRQNWQLCHLRENLNRIGGAASWIHAAENPDCPCCKKSMAFCAQFDFELAAENDDEAGGICYAFWCEACAVSGLLRQFS